MHNPKDYKILIIDDDKMFGQVIKSYLNEIGYDASVRNDTLDLDQYIDDSISIVLLDLYMPGQNGIKTLMQIKEKHPALPVVIMTGMSSNELRQTTESLGAVEHLTKPFAMSSLKSKFEIILEA